nr:reverse transcriptase domain, reverse transcriptase zinc-binding domain protein [Tanacetum cinerariifolium]
MPSEYQQDYKKTCAYAPKIYNDPNMPEPLRDIYRALESKYVHEGRTIDQSFYRDLTDESVAKFINIGFDCLLSLNEEICPSLPHFPIKAVVFTLMFGLLMNLRKILNSACIIKEALDEFKKASGLVPSLPKSTAYFCNVLNHVKLSILQALPFEEGKLPVKYLGVPLVSSRLMIRDCNELIDKVQIRIQDWKNKVLSIAGSLKLKTLFRRGMFHLRLEWVKGLAGLNASNPNIYDIIQAFLPIVKYHTTVSVIAKLVVAASAYYVWQERNWRLFKKGKRNSDQIVECIVSFVHLKLLSCKLKKSKSGERMARLWDLPEVVFI